MVSCLCILSRSKTFFMVLSVQDLNKVAFRFKDKERPRGYTSKVAGLLHVRPAPDSAACFQGDALGLVISVPACQNQARCCRHLF